jgi:hypothetical protein
MKYQELIFLRQVMPNMIFCFNNVFGLFFLPATKVQSLASLPYSSLERRNVKPFAKAKSKSRTISSDLNRSQATVQAKINFIISKRTRT